jgi:hypothetical protein
LPSSSPSVSVTPSVVPIPSALVVPRFNSTVPALAISGQSGVLRPLRFPLLGRMTSGLTSSGCWSGEEARQKVDLKLVSLEEISSVDNTVLQAIDLQTGTRFPRARRADRAPSPNQT